MQINFISQFQWIRPGYLSDRLQEALWREALHIINEGYATTEDLDRAIEDGPGLRYSLMGTFLTFHLAGGKAGMKHMLEQFREADFRYKKTS